MTMFILVLEISFVLTMPVNIALWKDLRETSAIQKMNGKNKVLLSIERTRTEEIENLKGLTDGSDWGTSVFPCLGTIWNRWVSK